MAPTVAFRCSGRFGTALPEGSPTLPRHVLTELDLEAWNHILSPRSFAHRYCALAHDTEAILKLGCEYAPRFAQGLRWNDPDLGIAWAVTEEDAIVHPRDLDRPRFRDLVEPLP